MRRTAVFLLLITLTLSAAPSKKKTAVLPAAPDEVPHSIAQFLRALSKDGKQTVTFKATATGTRFFFEESTGVTVYRYANGKYVRETFVKGGKLPGVVKRFAKT